MYYIQNTLQYNMYKYLKKIVNLSKLFNIQKKMKKYEFLSQKCSIIL